MKLGHQYLLLSLAVCSLEGCIVVARPPIRGPATDVIVYSVNSRPPPRPVGWQRRFQFYYYPSCQVYYAPHRNCYIWKGPLGWMTTPQPPQDLVLNRADAINVEIENDDPVACHAEVEARASSMAAKYRRPQRAVDASERRPDNAPDEVEVEVNGTVENPDEVRVEVSDEVKDGSRDTDGDRGEGTGAPSADDREAGRSGTKDKGEHKDKDKGKGKAKGKAKGKDKDHSDG